MKARIARFDFLGFRKGRLILDLDGDFRSTYDRLKDCDVEITVEKYSESRTLKANAYLWALITKIANALRESKEDIYLDMLKSYGQGGVASVQEKDEERFIKSYKYHEYMGESTMKGKVFKHYRFWVGSSEYSKDEFAILLDGVVEEAKNLGIETRSEEELASMLAEME